MSHHIHRRRLAETVVPGKRLGRHVEWDSRSLDYLVVADGTVATARWDRVIPVLDQGDVGSCTGNAATGCVGTDPNYAALEATPAPPVLNEAEALKLYSAAEVIDGDGPYPPNDNGSTGLSVAKAAKNAGLISGYTHITTLAAAQTAIQTGPFIVGTTWYTGMDAPDANGLVTPTGTVRGGHEYECIGYNTDTDLFEFVNSWGTDWGVDGHFFYSSASFTRLVQDDGDATVLLPLNVPAPTPTPPPIPVPAPIVDPSLANAALAAVATPWIARRHELASNKQMAVALEAWLAVIYPPDPG